MSLFSDGINDELFYLLWCKNDLPFQQAPSLHLPSTIIYKCGSPVAWYFTSSKSGKILKKSKANLLSVRIEEEFTKHEIAGDIVAYYLTLPNVFLDGEEDDDATTAGPAAATSGPHVQTETQHPGTGASASPTSNSNDDTRIEYFDKAGLHRFLFNRSKDCGILQQFVEPQGPRNSMIRAIWSPKLCVAERRSNIRHIYDRRFGLYERAVTYEGPDHHSQATPLRGNVLSLLIQDVCKDMVEHIAEVTYHKQRIARIVCNFKVDARGRLFFLWSSSIRLEETETLDSHQQEQQLQQQQSRRRGPPSSSSSSPPPPASPLPPPLPPLPNPDSLLNLRAQLCLPPDLELADTASHRPNGPPKPLLAQECPACQAKAASVCFHPVTYKMVVGLHDKTLTASAAAGGGNKKKGKDDEAVVPPLLRALHPELANVGVYRRCLQDPVFQQKQVLVCEECFLRHAEAACDSIGRQARAKR